MRAGQGDEAGAAGLGMSDDPAVLQYYRAVSQTPRSSSRKGTTREYKAEIAIAVPNAQQERLRPRTPTRDEPQPTQNRWFIASTLCCLNLHSNSSSSRRVDSAGNSPVE
jgi:hypothetical protein